MKEKENKGYYRKKKILVKNNKEIKRYKNFIGKNLKLENKENVNAPINTHPLFYNFQIPSLL